MEGSVRLKTASYCVLLVVGTALCGVGLSSCGGAPTPFVVQGPGVSGNEAPTLTIEAPNQNTTASRGDFIPIRWTDADGDSNAQISFSLVNTVTNEIILLIQGLDENDTTGPDQFTAGTSLIPVGTYNLLGVIDDGVNLPVEAFAQTTAETVVQRLVITIVPPGQGPPTVPPVVTVTQPAFNLSVAQDDVLNVTVQPSELNPSQANPYDEDSEVTLFILLDLDQDPNNDDPANPDPEKIILLQAPVTVPEGNFEARSFEITIDLATIPPRPNGEPYFIRATVDDANNPRVHQYAVGTISVVELAAGTVDLFDIGRTKSGVRWYGFNPGANLGSSIAGIGDFDADGVADFILVAQFGNPRNFGLVGEAYLIYGQNQTRFGGSIGVNSVSDTISGVIFEAPPERRSARSPSSGALCNVPGREPSDGITDVAMVPDLTQDGRPELLFGLPHVIGAFDAMDYDPGDQDLAGGDNRTDIEIVIRQGEVTVKEDNGRPIVTSLIYRGVDEVTIDSAQPNTSLGTEVSVGWQDAGPGNRKWGLIKFRDVLDEIPDILFGISILDITTVEARLEVRVFRTGAEGRIFQAASNFNDQTTFANFARDGGEPIENVDYLLSGLGQGSLGTIDATTPEVVTVDVAPLVRQLIDGRLQAGFNDELRFIIIPDAAEGTDESAVRSSEWNIESERPTLRIEYTRINFGGADGCYPDDLINNTTDESAQDEWDVQYYAGGMAVYFDSANRDNNPRPGETPPRLDTTSVALELVGQEGRFLLDRDGVELAGAPIFVRADNFAETGRIAGARFTAGGFDCVDHRLLNQAARSGKFGQSVGSIGDLNNDGLAEIIISAPRNEAYMEQLDAAFGEQSTHLASTMYKGSIVVFSGNSYNDAFWREKGVNDDSSSIIPTLDQQHDSPFGGCNPSRDRGLFGPADVFQVFAEDKDDFLGGARSAGDFNQDGLDDILCGAPLNDFGSVLENSGAVYILYGRSNIGDFDLKNADDPLLRAPMLRIRGETREDQIGWRQATGLDVNGDRIDDVFISSPRADFGNVTRSTCAGDLNGDGQIDSSDLDASVFAQCKENFGEEVFTDDRCKIFDYDNDGDIEDDDNAVFTCLINGGDDCCDHLIDNGFVGIIFGGVFTDGDRVLSQIATPDLPGVIFHGASTGHRAGYDVSSAGDFNQDGFGDILIAVPGETRIDRAGRERLGVVYLIFGGTHLHNTTWSLERVGTDDLPGIVFLSPYLKGRPNEAAPLTVAFLGDINRDGFGDIAIGNPKADFIDFSFPQGPTATDAELGRRRDAGDAYIVYGNNFGSNRGGGGGS